MSDVQTASSSAVDPPRERLMSVDALRGFDMFWIIGGEHVAKAMEPLGDGGFASTLATQLKHVEWEGFRFYDLIFPLFLFLVGVSIVLSLDRLIARSGRRSALIRIARRSVLLFVLGVFYYGGVSRAWPDVQLSGVLPRIALCYFFAASLYVCLSRRGIAIAAATCLVGYWLMMTFVPFPDVDLQHRSIGRKGSQADAVPVEDMLADVTTNVSGKFEEGRNLAHYADFRWLPGRKRNLYYTNEGLLSTIPAVAVSLMGIMAGWVLVSDRGEKQKVLWLVSAGIVAVGIGLLWSLHFPIIKRIWTSSYCIIAGGLSSIMLGVFYLIVDVLRWRKWCTPFLWIGANSLAVYMVVNIVKFDALAERLVGGDVHDLMDARFAEGAGQMLVAVVALLLPLLLVRLMYQKKVFIRL